MGFDSLLGNQRLKDNLRHSLSRGRASHFYLISGPAGAGKHTLAKLLAAALICTGEDAPCGCCDGCRKVFNGTHPDFITIDDPEKKTVPVDLIRQARADIYVQPNEADRKVYLFPRGQDMAIPGQNALLKILEEPPKYGVFLLLTDNAEAMLPTVRSRCVELELRPLSPEEMTRALSRKFPEAEKDAIQAAISRSGGFLGQAMAMLDGSSEVSQQTVDFAESFTKGDGLAMTRLLVSMEKWKRDQLVPELQGWAILLEEALACKAGGTALSQQARTLASARSSADLMAAIRQLQKCIEYAQSNVSCAAVCGYLQWALR